MTGVPNPGDLLHITRAASVQFIEPIFFRVIQVHDWVTYDGWIWLSGYRINNDGEAVERRLIFVQRGGLRWLHSPPQRNRVARPRGNRGHFDDVRRGASGNRR